MSRRRLARVLIEAVQQHEGVITCFEKKDKDDLADNV
jgi:hypothetical protein